MTITIQEAREYPRSLGAQYAFNENLDDLDDELIIRAVEIAVEQKDDLLREHVEQAVKERRPLKGDPVFGFLEKKPGTTLIHFTTDLKETLCGRDCSDWYGDDDLTLADVECKRCEQAIRKAKKAAGESRS